ncbi:hypothetical protein OG943_37505 [Amycolatopsis sp. NBC_00345]
MAIVDATAVPEDRGALAPNQPLKPRRFKTLGLRPADGPGEQAEVARPAAAGGQGLAFAELNRRY